MTLVPRGEELTPQEAARCDAMAERAELHSASAEEFARQLAALRAEHPAVVDALALVVAIYLLERARCQALGVSRAPTLEEALDRNNIISRATFDQPLEPLRRICN